MVKRAAFTKTVTECIYQDHLWNVRFGELRRRKGNPGLAERLFRIVGEKLPYEAISAVKKHVEEYTKKKGIKTNGVYIAHDSMGFPRYIGRSDIFTRLRTRKDAQELELAYFSFYVVSEKKHEREIETLLIRAAGPLLEFNTRKKRVNIVPGNITDYEAGTVFYERQYKKGR